MKGCGRKIGDFDCCTIIEGDCNDHLWMLPPGSIDLVVTDPPFGMNFVSGARKEKHAAIVGDDALPIETINQLIGIPRLASYFFMRWDNLWEHGALPKPKSVLTWIKPGTGMGDLEHEHGRAEEIAIFYNGPEHKFKTRPSTIIKADRTGNQLHPTQKPVELISEMLSWYDFETVLDPYMGSGTTARAAKLAGKHFLGFEIDPLYYKKACDFASSGHVDQDLLKVSKDNPNLTFGGLLDGQQESN
jgi:DNA modification methylase